MRPGLLVEEGDLPFGDNLSLVWYSVSKMHKHKPNQTKFNRDLALLRNLKSELLRNDHSRYMMYI